MTFEIEKGEASALSDRNGLMNRNNGVEFGFVPVRFSSV